MEVILTGDVTARLAKIASESVQCAVTSPPYWGLRDYGIEGQIGLEPTPQAYVARLVEVFREVRRVLRDDGTLWLNLGDGYFGDTPPRKASSEAFIRTWNPGDSAGNGGLRRSAATVDGLKPKDLIGIPWRVAFALQADGWWLRSDIIWVKPNPMPESVTDRPTKAHEHMFLLTKSARYYYNAAAIAEPYLSDRPDMATKGLRTGVAYLEQGEGPPDNSRPRCSGNKARKVAVAGERGRTNTHMGSSIPWKEQPGGRRNARDVWTIATQPYLGAHFATFPEKLADKCILAGSRPGDTVLDPFCGSGTTLAVADRLGRKWIGIDLKPEYVEMARRRLAELSAALPAEAWADEA